MEKINPYKYEIINLTFIKYSMTYMTEDDWNKFILPILKDGKSFSAELNQIIYIQNIFLELLERIFPKESHNALKQNILYSSMIYYYKYILSNQIHHSAISLEEKIFLCLSCIFIAFKAERKILDIDYLIKKVLPYLNDKITKNNDIQKERLKETIFDREYKILISFECNMGIDNPYLFLRNIKAYLEEIKIQNDIIGEIIKDINYCINDSLLFPLYLYYTSYEIALSSTLIVIYKKNYNFINLNDLIKLTKLEIDKERINQCTVYIKKICNALEEKKSVTKYNVQDSSRNNLNFTNILSINANQ